MSAGCSRQRQPVALPARPDLAAFPAALVPTIAQAEADIRHAPDDAAPWLKLGALYQANGFFAEARLCHEKIVAQPNEAASASARARASYCLANAAEFSGDLTAQLHWLEETLRLDPTYAPAQLLLAESRFKSGNTAAAVAAYHAVLKREPGNATALVGLARERMRTGDDTGAAAILEDLTAQHPKFSTGLALLAEVVDHRGDTARAASLRERARARKDPPRDDPWMDELLQSCFDVQRLSIRFEDDVKSGREKEALVSLHRIEAVDPSHWLVARSRDIAASQQGNDTLAVAEFQRALAAGGDAASIQPSLIASLIALKRLPEAEEIARAGLKTSPNSPGLLLAFAELRARQRDPAEAIRVISQVLARDPQNLAAHRSLARVQWDSGNRAEAVPSLEFVRRASASDVTARGMLGQFHLEKGDPAAATAPLSEAFALDPKNAGVRSMLALAHVRVANQQAREQQFADALATYDRAIAIQPDLIEAHANKARVCAHAGWFDRAELAMAPLIALQPNDAALLLNLGDIQQAAGKSSEARASWSRAAELLAAHPDEKLRVIVAQRLEKLAAR